MAGEVEFHTGVADPVGFACRLLRKALRVGAKVMCTAPPARLEELDRALWTFEEREFVPHVRLGPTTPARVRDRTPIWLGLRPLPEAADRVWVNIGGELPEEMPAHARVIEIVAADTAEAAAGRERWRRYKAAGREVVHYPAAAGRPE